MKRCKSWRGEATRGESDGQSSAPPPRAMSEDPSGCFHLEPRAVGDLAMRGRGEREDERKKERRRSVGSKRSTKEKTIFLGVRKAAIRREAKNEKKMSTMPTCGCTPQENNTTETSKHGRCGIRGGPRSLVRRPAKCRREGGRQDINHRCPCRSG